ncbi:MAG: hypothetical protein Q7R22_012705 [Verrucomicrobiota bacterium JB025]|nr:hypothetical protein [Verrucomicrobiota bacterium JB025]
MGKVVIMICLCVISENFQNAEFELGGVKAKPVSQIPETGGLREKFRYPYTIPYALSRIPRARSFPVERPERRRPSRSNEGERRARGGGGISGLEERSNFLPVELTRLMPEKPKQPAASRFRSWQK